jgi:SAM-dependent methyltransferase
MLDHINRRSLLTAATASGSLLAAAQATVMGRPAAAAPSVDIQPRGQVDRFERLPDLSLESFHDYLRGFRMWSSAYGLRPACMKRAAELVKAHGVDPDQSDKLTYEQLLPMLENDPTMNLFGRAWLDGQWYKFQTLQDAFHARADEYFTEMEAADNVGPGSLEMSLKQEDIPDYTKHEIHTQLGGYVGDPFAGYIYLYDVLILNDGRDEQDIGHIRTASLTPTPEDGKVKRILDYGCGAGQLAVALKQRFPDAEVHAIDVGAPMIRYGHQRANDMGVDVNFAQRLAEDNGYPDDYFDIICTNIVHHEVTADASREIFKEVYRTLRSGGIYYPTDVAGTFTGVEAPRDAWGRYRQYLNWRWNHEDWILEWMEMDRKGAMRDAGLIVNTDGPVRAGRRRQGSRGNYVATKA